MTTIVNFLFLLEIFNDYRDTWVLQFGLFGSHYCYRTLNLLRIEEILLNA